MVREITMFELHFDGARFGPAVGETDEEVDAESVDEETTDSSGPQARAIAATVGALAIASVVGLRVVRRMRAARDAEIEGSDVTDETTELSVEQ